MKKCEECKEKEKEFKILEADLLFQIKKMKEDLSQEKVTLELQFQKQTKKVFEKYQKQKLEREEDNNNWIEKYDGMIGDYQQKIKQVHVFYQQKQKQFQDETKLKHAKREQQNQQKHHKMVDLLTKDYNKSIEQISDNYKQEIHIVKKSNQQAIKKILHQNEIQIKDVKCNYENNIVSLEKQITYMKDNFNKLQLEDHRKQTALYEDLQQKRNYINSLKSEIDQLQNTIMERQIQLKLKTKEIQMLNQQYSSKMAKIQKDFDAQRQNILKNTNEQIQNILKKKLDDCQKLGLVVKNIEEKRQSQIKIYESNMKEVKQLVEERPSRQEDVKKINQLKEQLALKQKEFQKAFQEAKHYRLELNNKEETYCKIFAAYASPLNIEKINKRKQLKKSRASITLIKDITSKYNSSTALHAITSAYECRREKLSSPKSTKRF